jgi:hypothetical protein
MKKVKIVGIATLALVAAALLISTAVAMPVSSSSNRAYGGMMNGYSHAQTSPAAQNHHSGSSFSFGRMMNWFGNGFGQMMRWFRR